MSVTNTILSALVLADEYSPEIVSLVNQKAKCLQYIPVIQGAGQQCAWVGDGYGSSATEIAEMDAFPSATGRDEFKCLLPWSLVFSKKVVSDLALAAAASSSSPAGNMDQMKRLVMQAADDFAKRVSSKFYTGTSSDSPTAIVGLADALGSSNTYAGIDRSQAANYPFRSYVVDPGVDTAITKDLIRTDLFTIQDQSGDMPNLAFCSSKTMMKIIAAFEGTSGFIIPVLTQDQGSSVLAANYTQVMIGDCRFVVDPDCPAGHIKYLNTDHIEFRVLQPSVNSDSALVRVSTESNVLPLGLQVHAAGKTGPFETFAMGAFIQLVVRKPLSMGVRKHVLES